MENIKNLIKDHLVGILILFFSILLVAGLIDIELFLKVVGLLTGYGFLKQKQDLNNLQARFFSGEKRRE